MWRDQHTHTNLLGYTFVWKSSRELKVKKGQKGEKKKEIRPIMPRIIEIEDESIFKKGKGFALKTSPI